MLDWLRMKSGKFRVALIVGVLFLSLPVAWAKGGESSLEIVDCKLILQTPFPVQVIENEPTWFSARRSPPARLEYMISGGCRPNGYRTSRVSVLKKGKGPDGKTPIDRMEERTLPGGLEGIVFRSKKEISGRRIHSVEAYFASRDFEYRFSMIPLEDLSKNPEPGTISPEEFDVLQTEMMGLLDGIQFTEAPPVPIEESTYQLRFYSMLGGAGILVLLPVLFLIRRKRSQSWRS